MWSNPTRLHTECGLWANGGVAATKCDDGRSRRMYARLRTIPA
jgi:hypothetical protein